MKRVLVVLVAALLLPAAAKRPAAPPYQSLTRAFAQFYDATATMPEKERVAAFRAQIAPRFPGFYKRVTGQSEEQFDRSVAVALDGFPKIRAKYEQAERDFPRAYAAGIRHFRAQFPDFKQNLPVWLLHSLGRMDGGTRTVYGTTYLIFGADVIAKIHDSKDIGPFLDHEMFHVENARWFNDCDQMWCSLWQEGLATYAASVMNRGAGDHVLMLDSPKPIRAAVDADWRRALCTTRGDLMSSDGEVYVRYFYGNDDSKRTFPARYGYYIGFRVVQRLGKTYSLRQLDHMSNAVAKPVVAKQLDAMIAEAGGCPA